MQLPLSLAFAFAMPLTRGQAFLQSPPTTTESRVTKRPRRHTKSPNVKTEPMVSAAVKLENRFENDEPHAKLEQKLKFEPLAYPSAKTEPELGNVKRSTKIAKTENEVVCDIEDTLLRPPSASVTRAVTQRLRTFHRDESDALSHPKTKPRPLVDSLIATILSQATSNVNSSRAFSNLKQAFPCWDDALAAGPSAVEDAIRCGGLAAQKAVVIIGVLLTLKKERGEASLEYLRDMPDGDVKKELCRFKGVGPKTAACVLMFGMKRAEFPVDTHVRRLAGRLGWMPLGASAEKTYEVLNGCVPDEIKYDLHVLLIEHGRKICKSQRPNCRECPLADICPAAGVFKEEEEEEKGY